MTSLDTGQAAQQASVGAADGRRPVVIDEVEAAALVQDGMTIAIGGFILHEHPMAIIRQIIRRGVSGLSLIGAASAGLEIDLLIGAGCVRKLVTAYVGAESLAPIAPLFKAACEAGEIELWECDESSYYAALRAGALGLPSMGVRGIVGTSYPDLNPDLVPYADPVTGEPLVAVPAIRPDLAILHASCADAYGNVQYVGTGFGDRALYNAAERTIVQVDRLLPVEETRKDPGRTAIPYADAIVKAPYGAHPFASSGHYLEDAEHLREYLAAARERAKTGNRSRFDEYLRKYVTGPQTHLDYLEAIGVRRLMSLSEY